MQVMQEQMESLRKATAAAEDKAVALGDEKNQLASDLADARHKNAQLLQQLESSLREKAVAIDELHAAVLQQQQKEVRTVGTQLQVQAPRIS